MKPNVFEYSNYREFLKDYYNYSKVTNENFSYRYFAQKAGFSSSNFLYLIIEGDRNLTKDFVPKFSNAIGFSKGEQQFFDTLISFNQAKTPEAKKYYLELLHNLKREKVGVLLSDAQYEYISTWYYPVIREMALLTDFTEDPVWIKSQLANKVTSSQVQDAISILFRLGLFKKDESGRTVQSEAHISTENEVAHAAAYSFHQQMLSIAKEILETLAAEKREISGVTMALSKKQFDEIKSRVHDFEDSIIRYLADNPETPEAVYQINVQLFPVTGVPSANGNGGKNE